MTTVWLSWWNDEHGDSRTLLGVCDSEQVAQAKGLNYFLSLDRTNGNDSVEEVEVESAWWS